MTSKRGAAEAAGPSDGPKRQRIDASDGPDVATEVGLKFISQLKVSKDKTGRDIAPPFFTLPPRSLEEYYRVIKLPMAIDTVEEKLNRREYQSISAVESDLKRMVKNAKDYNDRNSSIFADAERIRKLLSNFMVKHNPAYNDPNYVAVATSAPGENEEAEQNAIRAMVNTRRQFKSLKEGKSPAANMDIETAGDSSQEKFQNAQEGIINELLDHQDDDGYNTYSDFVNLPPRGLKAYYATIEQPMSLKAVQKKIKGQEGRKQGAGTSIYKSWDELEEDISLIWRNARQFNEDGSALFVLAGEFEEHFRRLLAEAKEAVPELYQGNGEASAPRIKLNMKTQDTTQKLKLRFGGQKSDRQSSDEAQVIVDNDSLRRQREHVNAGANGRGISGVETSEARAGTRNPFGGSSSSSGPAILPNIGQIGQERNRSASAASPALSASAIKPEVPLGQTPLLSAIETGKDSQASDEAASSSNFAATAAHMPPPSSGALRSSANPYPPQTHPQYQAAQHRKTTPFENHYRPPGKDASSALILSTTISTHPDLDTKGDPHYSHTFSAHDVISQQSFNFHLPATSYFLRIIPTTGPLPPGWDSKLVVQLDSAIQSPKFYDAEQRPVFDTRLYPHDLHTITVERLAGPSRGAPKSGHPPVQDMEYEKLTLHVNLLKH